MRYKQDYNNIEVGDLVERVSGHWGDHGVGWIGVVTGLENGHLRFEDGNKGHSPTAHRVIKRRGSVVDLIGRVATHTIQIGGNTWR